MKADVSLHHWMNAPMGLGECGVGLKKLLIWRFVFIFKLTPSGDFCQGDRTSHVCFLKSLTTWTLSTSGWICWLSNHQVILAAGLDPRASHVNSCWDPALSDLSLLWIVTLWAWSAKNNIEKQTINIYFHSNGSFHTLLYLATLRN